MLAVIAKHGPGSTKAEIAEALRREEVNRGLTFEYCLIAAGTSHNRAPSEQRWEKGDVLSVDSGGNYHGYIGDLARMAILGEPDAELEDLLGEIETIQRAAFKPIKAGVMGGEIYAAGEALLAKSKYHNNAEIEQVDEVRVGSELGIRSDGIGLEFRDAIGARNAGHTSASIPRQTARCQRFNSASRRTRHRRRPPRIVSHREMILSVTG